MHYLRVAGSLFCMHCCLQHLARQVSALQLLASPVLRNRWYLSGLWKPVCRFLMLWYLPNPGPFAKTWWRMKTPSLEQVWMNMCCNVLLEVSLLSNQVYRGGAILRSWIVQNIVNRAKRTLSLKIIVHWFWKWWPVGKDVNTKWSYLLG